MGSTSGDTPKLTRRQKVYVEVYLGCWNQTEAARVAGFAFPDVAGVKLMKLPQVQDAIAVRMKELHVSADEVLTRLGQQARLNAAMFFYFGWVPVMKHGEPVLDKETKEPLRTYEMLSINWEVFEKYGYLVKKLSYDRRGNPMIEFYDAQNALMLIGKSQRLFIDRVDSTNINIDVSADDMAVARAKAQEFEKALLNNASGDPGDK